MSAEQRKASGIPSAVHAKCAVHLTGELVFSLGERRPVSLHLEGPVQFDWKMEYPNFAMASRSTQVEKGTLKLSVVLNGAEPSAPK